MILSKLSVNRVSVRALLWVVCAEALNMITQCLSFELRDKLFICMIFVFASYFYMIRHCIKNKQIINVLFMIIILSIFFYYGQHIVALIDSKYLILGQNNHILDGKLKDNTIIRATYLAIECLLLVFSGYNITTKKNKIDSQEHELEISDYDVKLQALKVVGWFVLLVSLFPTIKLLIAQYHANIVYGYLERRALESDPNYYQILGISPIFNILSQFFLISLYALLIAYKGKKIKPFISTIIVIYCILYYLTGSRFALVKMFITLFLIESIWINPIGKKNIKKYVAIISILGIAFVFGTALRSNEVNISDIGSVIAHLKLEGMFWETGITFTSISNIIENCPSIVDYFYGKSVIGAILQCLPEIFRFGFFDKYTLHISSIFSPLYYHVTNHGYGSSFIAEAYYNFGPLIGIFMLIYGRFLRFIQDKMECAKVYHSPYIFLILTVLCGSLVYGVRNDLSSVLREMLFTVVIFVVLTCTVEKFLLQRD